ncbi:MAG TPA: hypothetical protein VF651_10255 [Gammaproteobacteria bacterium]
MFVAVGSGGETRGDDGNPWIEVSTDGINWTPDHVQYTDEQLNEAYTLRSVTYGSNGFVTTDGVHVLHSTDGLNWTVESFESASDKISYVLYDGTRYILYSNTDGPSGKLGMIDNFPWKVSTDGVDWADYGAITINNGPAGEPVSIIHVGGMYEAAWQPAENVPGNTRYLTATSTDGLSWTLGTPVAAVTPKPTMYWILHAGDQYLVYGGIDDPAQQGDFGVVLYGSSMSAMKVASPLTVPSNDNLGDVADDFDPTGSSFPGPPYQTHGLVSNGTVAVALGTPGLFVSTDGIAWHWKSMDGVVPLTACNTFEGNICSSFASGAAAPGGSIVVLVASGSAGAETTDGIHWVTSNL